MLIHGGNADNKHIASVVLDPAVNSAVQIVRIGGDQTVPVTLPGAGHHKAAGVIKGVGVSRIGHKGVVPGGHGQIGAHMLRVSFQQRHGLADGLGTGAQLAEGHHFTGADAEHGIFRTGELLFIEIIDVHIASSVAGRRILCFQHIRWRGKREIENLL